jgi:hypothetical protein
MSPASKNSSRRFLSHLAHLPSVRMFMGQLRIEMNEYSGHRYSVSECRNTTHVAIARRAFDPRGILPSTK